MFKIKHNKDSEKGSQEKKYFEGFTRFEGPNFFGKNLGNSKVYKILQLKFYSFAAINIFYKHSNNIEFVRPNLSPNKFGPSKP